MIKGLYKYKVSDLDAGIHTFDLYVNGVKTSTATAIIRPFCLNSKLVKYLDSKGRYRFFPFNDLWQLSKRVNVIGEKGYFVTSTKTGQSDSRVIGYEQNKVLSLTAEEVSPIELEKLFEIYDSPRVYLYVGSGTDKEKDWIIVRVTGDNIGRTRKQRNTKVSINIELPTGYAVAEI